MSARFHPFVKLDLRTTHGNFFCEVENARFPAQTITISHN